MTTEVWHRDQMKVVEDPIDRDADADIKERGAAMGAAIKHNRERPHVVTQEQDADLGQSDADEHADILADQMVTHTAQLSDAHHIMRVSDCGRNLPKRHAARRVLDDELEPLDVLITTTYDPSSVLPSDLNNRNALHFSLIRRTTCSTIFGSKALPSSCSRVAISSSGRNKSSPMIVSTMTFEIFSVRSSPSISMYRCSVLLRDTILSKNLSCSDGNNAWYLLHFSWCYDSMCLVMTSARKLGPYVWFAMRLVRLARFWFAMSTCRPKYLQNEQTASITADVLTSRFVTRSPSLYL